MGKGWKYAPWQVRLVFIFWLLWFLWLVVPISILFIMTLGMDVGNLWRIPFDLLKHDYQRAPISTSVEIMVVLVTLLGFYYAWRVMRGSGISRAIIELFSWFLVLTSAVYMLFPDLGMTEEEIEAFVDADFWYTLLGWGLLAIEAGALYLVRSRPVREFANIY